MPNRWLLKTEPSAYSFQQLVKDKKTVWDGIKNNLALKNLSQIKNGDSLLIYHTGGERTAMGLARARSGAYPDPEKNDPRMLVIDLEVDKPLSRAVSLAEMKANPRLNGFDLFRLSRLSVVPVSDEQWNIIMEMAGK
jgi:predicted RNA-binding protein with PUA-like domain